MSTILQPTVQATPLWKGPPLKPIPELPPIDASRIIDLKKYDEMVEEEDRVRSFEAQYAADRPLLLIMFSIIEKEEGIWKTPSHNCRVMYKLYKQAAIELYGRTGELVSYQSIMKIWQHVKDSFRGRIYKAITVDKMSPEDMERHMWNFWPYPTTRFYRVKLMDWEEKLRRELNNSSRKRSQAPPTQTPSTTKRREDEKNQNQNRNPSSSSGIQIPKPQILVPVKPLHQHMNLNPTSPGFRIPKPEPHVVQVHDDFHEFETVENDEDYGAPGIPNASPSPTDSSIQDDYQIHLDVGGVSFTTIKSTLMKKSGWFRENLGTDYQKFIDRDGTHFRLILNYMRDDVIILPDSTREIQEVQREAMFYEMHELIGICMLKLEKMKKN